MVIVSDQGLRVTSKHCYVRLSKIPLSTTPSSGSTRRVQETEDRSSRCTAKEVRTDSEQVSLEGSGGEDCKTRCLF